MDTSSQIHPDYVAFANDLSRDDDLGCAVRAHIRVENRLIAFVEQRVADASHLKRLNLEYDQYVSLALALGFDPRWGPVLRAMGKLRNNFAHRLDSALDANVVGSLYEALPPSGKEGVQDCYTNIRRLNPELPLAAKFSELDAKSKFQLVALIVWSRVEAWVLETQAPSGA